MWWVTRRRHEARVHELAGAIARRSADLRQAHQLTQQQHDQITTLGREYAAALHTLQQEVRSLLERLVTAEGAARKADALVTMWEVRVNQLQAERDQMLVRLLPGLDLATPHITTTGGVVQPSAVSFAHDPDAPAGFDDLIPQPDDGALGTVYTPEAY